MHSLPFSIGIHPTPTTRSLLLTKNNRSPIPSSAIKLHESNCLNGSSSSLSRREAISIVFSFSLLQIVHPAAAESVAASPCQFQTSPSGLEYCDKVVGTGPEAVKGQLIKAHYVGRLEDGKIFDSSYNRGKPLTFRLGVGEVIKGWDQGILGGDGIPAMLAGGKRELRIPPALGYGIRGAGCRAGSCIIPPDSVLLFDVEFVGKA